MKERDRTRGQIYEAINNEDSDEEHDFESTKRTDKLGKSVQTEPLAVRILRVRKRRYWGNCKIKQKHYQ